MWFRVADRLGLVERHRSIVGFAVLCLALALTFVGLLSPVVFRSVPEPPEIWLMLDQSASMCVAIAPSHQRHIDLARELAGKLAAKLPQGVRIGLAGLTSEGVKVYASPTSADEIEDELAKLRLECVGWVNLGEGVEFLREWRRAAGLNATQAVLFTDGIGLYDEQTLRQIDAPQERIGIWLTVTSGEKRKERVLGSAEMGITTTIPVIGGGEGDIEGGGDWIGHKLMEARGVRYVPVSVRYAIFAAAATASALALYLLRPQIGV